MVLAHIVQVHVLNGCGSVLNLDLANIWPQCSVDQVCDHEANIG